MRLVSDRRLVKSVAMLRIAAYTNGRRAVNEYDVLLLQHVLWQRPEEAERIRDWLLERIVKDGATEQVSVRALRGQPQPRVRFSQPSRTPLTLPPAGAVFVVGAICARLPCPGRSAGLQRARRRGGEAAGGADCFPCSASTTDGRHSPC